MQIDDPLFTYHECKKQHHLHLRSHHASCDPGFTCKEHPLRGFRRPWSHLRLEFAAERRLLFARSVGVRAGTHLVHDVEHRESLPWPRRFVLACCEPVTRREALDRDMLSMPLSRMNDPVDLVRFVVNRDHLSPAPGFAQLRRVPVWTWRHYSSPSLNPPWHQKSPGHCRDLPRTHDPWRTGAELHLDSHSSPTTWSVLLVYMCITASPAHAALAMVMMPKYHRVSDEHKTPSMHCNAHTPIPAAPSTPHAIYALWLSNRNIMEPQAWSTKCGEIDYLLALPPASGAA